MNMFAKNDANSIEEYINSYEGDEQESLITLHQYIISTVPTLLPYFANNMLGYGKFQYTNTKKELVDWPIIALAKQKNYFSIYVCALEGEQYIAEKYASQLGDKVSVGKSCIRFKKLSDLNLLKLAEVLKYAEKVPGLTNYKTKQTK